MNSPETTSPEKISWLEKRAVKRAARSIFDRVNDNSISEPTQSLDFCVRPTRELSEQQSAIYKRYGYGKEANQFTPRSEIRLVKTEEGTVLYYGSSRFLHYLSHRFIMDSAGVLSYHQEAFNVDCQMIQPTPINLHGIDEIAASDKAKTELYWLDDELNKTRYTQWVEGERIEIKDC